MKLSDLKDEPTNKHTTPRHKDEAQETNHVSHRLPLNIYVILYYDYKYTKANPKHMKTRGMFNGCLLIVFMCYQMFLKMCELWRSKQRKDGAGSLPPQPSRRTACVNLTCVSSSFEMSLTMSGLASRRS